MDEYFIEEKSSFDKFMDLLVFFAVAIVTIFLVLEILGISGAANLSVVKLDVIYFWVNIVVFIIFVADLVRLWQHSNGGKDFFKHNWLDVLATIPFGLIAFYLGGIDPKSPAFAILKWLRVARLSGISKLQKISRISKISKEFKAAAHLKREGEEYQRKHRL